MCGLKFPPLSGHLVSPPPSGNAALHWLGVYEKWSGKKKCRGISHSWPLTGFYCSPGGGERSRHISYVYGILITAPILPYTGCLHSSSQISLKNSWLYKKKLPVSVFEKFLSWIVVKGQNFTRRNYCHEPWSKVKISVWEIIVMCNLDVLCIGSAYSIATVSTIFNPLVTFANFFQPI